MVQLFECIYIILIRKNPNHFPYFHPTSSELQTFHVKVAILHSVGVLCVLSDGIFSQPTHSRALIFFPKKKERKGGKFPTTRTNRFNFHKLSTHHHPGKKVGAGTLSRVHRRRSTEHSLGAERTWGDFDINETMRNS